jgi:NitT/TauT family transport system ATP-binding protein
VAALADVSLALRRHEFLGLLGPSGCGKSTLLRLIAGLGAPSGGRIDWPGAQANAAAKGRRDIGFVFQEPTLMPWADVGDNIYLPLRLAGRGRREAAAPIARAIELVGLEGFERAFPRELSGGMKMRVSIARALVTEPEILLLDEPFAALDEITRSRLNDDLLALWAREKLSVLFVTHSIYESVYLSSRVLVMTPRPGRVAAEIAIPDDYPRDERFRVSPAYSEHCRAVSAALRDAMGAAA